MNYEESLNTVEKRHWNLLNELELKEQKFFLYYYHKMYQFTNTSYLLSYKHFPKLSFVVDKQFTNKNFFIIDTRNLLGTEVKHIWQRIQVSNINSITLLVLNKEVITYDISSESTNTSCILHKLANHVRSHLRNLTNQ